LAKYVALYRHVALSHRVEAGVRSVGVVRLKRRVRFVVVAGLTGNVQRAVHITDFEHLVGQDHLGCLQKQ
jgi:hypothetical protein